MIKNVLAMLGFLFVFTASATVRIAVLHTNDYSDLTFSQNLTARLNAYAPAQRFAIRDWEEISQIVQSNSELELFVILSNTAAHSYAQAVREGNERLVPHVSLLNQPLGNDKLSVLLRHGTVVVPSLDPVLALRGISRSNSVNIKSVAYLHCDESRNLALSEISHLESAQISTARRRLRVPVAADEFENAVKRFYENEITALRLFNSQAFLSFLQANPDMISYVERNTSVLLVDSREFTRMFPFAPVAVMEPVASVTERLFAMIVLAGLRETALRPRFTHPITLRSTRVVLFDEENRRGENITADVENTIFASAERIWQQITRADIDGDMSWAMISELGMLVDTSAATNRNLASLSAKSTLITRINRVVETLAWGYTTLGIILIALIFNFAKIFKKKQYKRRIALIIPEAVKKVSLVGSDGHNISLKLLLEHEGYHSKKASSKGEIKKVLRKTFPNVIIADWESARVFLQSAYNELTGAGKFKQLGLIIINIPLNKQTNVKKLYDGASVYCYEDAPTLDDILTHLRGDKHFSAYSEGSYMSGVIQEDNLTVILQMIEGNMYTGCLMVEDDKPISLIYFRGGRVVYAVDKSGESGVKPIYNALSCRRGAFYFHLNRTAANETLNLGMMEILMGWADQRDRFTQKINAIDGKK